MKLKFLSSLVLMLALPATGLITDSAAYAASSPKKTVRKTANNSRYAKYTGTVGKYKVTVFLDEDNNGYYYYGNGSKGKLSLRGVYEGYGGGNYGHYYLYEYNKAGQQTAVWDVYIGVIWDGTAYITNISGTMTTNGRTYDVELW